MGEPAKIQSAPEFKQDQAERNVDENRQLAEHGLIEQAQYARAKHQSGRDESGNARQFEYAHEYLADGEPAQQDRTDQDHVGGGERKGRQESDVVHAEFYPKRGAGIQP